MDGQTGKPIHGDTIDTAQVALKGMVLNSELVHLCQSGLNFTRGALLVPLCT